MAKGTWSNRVLDENVAPGFSSFTSASIPDLRPEFPTIDRWLADYFLNTVLRGRFAPAAHQLVHAVLRRGQHAFDRYHEARDLTLQFVARSDSEKPGVLLYYRALDKWESFALQYAMAVDLLRAIGDGAKLFEKGDGSVDERLYTISNQIKHHASCIESSQAPADHTVPIWLSNDGLCSFGHSVSFAEVADTLRDLASAVERLKDPRSFVESLKRGPNGVT